MSENGRWDVLKFAKNWNDPLLSLASLASASAEAISPPPVDALKTQPASAPILPTDPGAVTPDPGPDQPPGVFVDPLSENPLADAVAAAAPQPAVAAAPLPAGGLSQVPQRQRVAATQQQQATTNAAAAPQSQPTPPAQAQPQPPLAQAQAQPSPGAQIMAQPQTQMAQPMVTQPVAPAMMAVHHPPLRPPPQPKPAPAAVAAPIPQQRPPMRKPAAMVQPPHKRPRVQPPPFVPKAKSSYSFAASVASVNGTTAARAGGGGHAPLALPPAAPGGRQAQKSQAQIDRRRERNRILARRTRLRKKFFFESLQKDVADLQRENAALKSIVRGRLKPDDARAVLSQCNANERLPGAILQPDGGDAGTIAGPGVGGGGAGARKLHGEDFSLIRSIQNSQQCFIITDPSLHDNPIVYASDDFLTLTGYSQEEVLGRNCRFLQGTETCQEKVARVRDAVRAGGDVNVTLANYKSDGSPFWNSLFIAALRDADNNIVNFIGVIVKVSGPEPGDSEYGKVLK